MKRINRRLAALSRRLDSLWWLIARLLRLPRAGTAAPRSILLVDLHLIGDIVMLVPLLRVIRRCHPQARIGLLAGPWAEQLLRDTALVDDYIALTAYWVRPGPRIAGLAAVGRALRQCRRSYWDWGIDVRGDVRNILLLACARAARRIAYDFTGGSALLTDVVPDDGALRHIIEHHIALARYLGLEMQPEERIPWLPPPADGSPHSAGRTFGFHFGASQVLRRMPAAAAAELVETVAAAAPVNIVLVDSPDTEALNTALLAQLSADCASRVQRWNGSLRELMALLVRLERFYAMDSGPAHIAAALGVDTTVFFGPNLADAVRPWGARVTVLEDAALPCRPCDHLHCTNPRVQACLIEAVGLVRLPPGSTPP